MKKYKYKKYTINYNCDYYDNTGGYISSCDYFKECFASHNITCSGCLNYKNTQEERRK